MDNEWLKYFMPDIEGRSCEKPIPEPLIPVLGILCEARRNPEANEAFMKVKHTHWNLPIDLLTRNNKDSVHPLGITRKIKFRWNACKIQLYDDGAMQINKADISHFYIEQLMESL